MRLRGHRTGHRPPQATRHVTIRPPRRNTFPMDLSPRHLTGLDSKDDMARAHRPTALCKKHDLQQGREEAHRGGGGARQVRADTAHHYPPRFSTGVYADDAHQRARRAAVPERAAPQLSRLHRVSGGIRTARRQNPDACALRASVFSLSGGRRALLAGAPQPPLAPARVQCSGSS